MSRCFPFPPPGYEKKTRLDEDANLSIKENHEEKRQKKDKKDKEKKERREKDREKNREKKDKKHKHKEKKEKSWDKEEKKNAEEKNIVGLSDHQHSEKFGLTALQVDETQNSRHLIDFGKKVRNDNGAKEMQIVERITVSNLSFKSSGRVLEHKVGILDEGNQEFKDKREENRIPNGQTVNVNAIGLANGSVCNFPPKEQKNVEVSFYQEDKVMEKQKEQKDTNKHEDTYSRGNKHKGEDRENKSKLKDKKRKKEKEKEKAKELSIPMPSKLKESGNNAIDFKNDKGSFLFKESNVQNGILSKRKEPEMGGILNSNEFQNNRLPRLVSSSHQVLQTGSRIESSISGNQFIMEKEATVQKHKSNTSNTKFLSPIPRVENGRKLEMTQIAGNIAPERRVAVSRHGKANNSLSSLKPTLGTGGSLESCQPVRSCADLQQGVVINHTKDKKVVPQQPVAENGRKSQSYNLNAAERQGAACNPKLSDKESRCNGFVVPKLDERASKINGLVELKKPSTSSMVLPSAPLQHKEVIETLVKPPHPDAKYLSEILSVPKVEWSDVDEQKWLFNSEGHHRKKPKYVSPMIKESKQVWAEALQIESADVTALPYVIPY
ncbi:hypothetical protein ACH5RR_020431 [Cinchona calisaya]|uniref:Myb-like protein X n=1 Tax=Cinchona calisaya TaxID=153742 RepID=A0ABD2ZEE8_9GENT